MNIVEYTNKGRRPVNQDYLLHRILPDGTAICILADGMGGYEHGEVASEVVSKAIARILESDSQGYSPADLLKEAVCRSNDALRAEQRRSGIECMGTVVTVLLLRGDEAYLSWLGDSRIYLFRNNKEIYRTDDHSVLNELSKERKLCEEDYQRYTSVVTRCIMGDDIVPDVPVEHLTTRPGDTFILCSDGFYNEVGMDIARLYSPNEKEILDDMSDMISDNYSFIRVDL